MHGTVVSADTRGGAGREISAMAWRPYHFTAADMGGWSLSRSAAEHQRLGILTVRNAPDSSVDADHYQEPAANPAKSGHLHRLTGGSVRSAGRAREAAAVVLGTGCQDTFVLQHPTDCLPFCLVCRQGDTEIAISGISSPWKPVGNEVSNSGWRRTRLSSLDSRRATCRACAQAAMALLEGWPTVDQAEEIPDPDSSWMSDP
jgi:hypothetical protein